MKWVVRLLAGLIVLVVTAVALLWLWGMRPGHGHVVAEVQIERPAHQVFRWLTNDDLVEKWIGGLVELKEISAPADGSKVGRKFHVGEVYKGERADMEMTVTGFERDRALSLYVASVGDPSNGFTETGDYTLSEENGKTHLRFDLKSKYFGLLPRLFEPLIMPEANKKLAEDFQRLKQLVEAEPRPNEAVILR